MLHEASGRQPTQTRTRPLRDKQRTLSRNASAATKVAKSPDRRVARTQRLLYQALIALIFEQGWDGVTVQDVCARADVGRSTFYVHFADKEELLLSGFDQFERSLRAEVAAAKGVTLAFLRPLLEHVRGHQRLYSSPRFQMSA